MVEGLRKDLVAIRAGSKLAYFTTDVQLGGVFYAADADAVVRSRPQSARLGVRLPARAGLSPTPDAPGATKGPAELPEVPRRPTVATHSQAQQREVRLRVVSILWMKETY